MSGQQKRQNADVQKRGKWFHVSLPFGCDSAPRLVARSRGIVEWFNGNPGSCGTQLMGLGGGRGRRAGGEMTNAQGPRPNGRRPRTEDRSRHAAPTELVLLWAGDGYKQVAPMELESGWRSGGRRTEGRGRRALWKASLPGGPRWVGVGVWVFGRRSRGRGVVGRDLLSSLPLNHGQEFPVVGFAGAQLGDFSDAQDLLRRA